MLEWRQSKKGRDFYGSGLLVVCLSWYSCSVAIHQDDRVHIGCGKGQVSGLERLQCHIMGSGGIGVLPADGFVCRNQEEQINLVKEISI